MENFDSWDELTAFEVCKLAAKAIKNSQGFISAWEFDVHDMDVDGEDLHRELKAILTQLGFLKVTEDD